MTKEKTSFTLDNKALELLKLIAEHLDRSKASTIEVLIKTEAERLKIKLPKQP